MGFSMRIVFSAVDMAGELIGLQMGLGFATFFDHIHGVNSPVVAQLMGLIAMLFFLAINGHLLVITALAESFQVMPVGLNLFSPQAAYSLAAWGGHVFSAGFMHQPGAGRADADRAPAQRVRRGFPDHPDAGIPDAGAGAALSHGPAREPADLRRPDRDPDHQPLPAFDPLKASRPPIKRATRRLPTLRWRGARLR
jgi:hypothetical protein